MERAAVLSLFAAAACGDDAPPDPKDLPPVAEPSSFALTLAEEGSVDVEAGAIDPEGRPILYSTTMPLHGTLSGTGPLYRYTGALDFSGLDGFIVTASDGVNAVQIPVSLNVTPVNDAPHALPDQAGTREDVAVNITLAATDVDNAANTLTYAVATPPAHGALTGAPPNVLYTPNLHYSGTDSFTFTASDGSLTSAPATVVINIEDIITCGDGVVEGDEGCDDGNNIDTDACRNSCVSATCGDGTVQADVEQCDDGNNIDTDACRNNCMSATCGDSVVQAGVEDCDDGNQVDTDACRNSCVAAACGDGIVQDGVEACDDGNQIDTDACRNSCVAATCGDGIVQDGVEACDDGNNIDTDACRNSCVAAACGDGIVQDGVEACDDGNNIDTDACRNSCVAASCGDGVVQAGVEACDDGNQSNTDSCLNSCQSASCGDGFTQAGVEACDDANQSNTDACLNTCQSASCGDGFIQAGVEQCDDANQSNTDACLNTCVAASCGDSFTRAGVEQCDDGNQSNTDACLNTCTNAACGDGFTNVGVEQCDDANLSNFDSCLNTCANAACGDGFIRDGVEVCDDGNQSNNDACLNTCVAASCGDGFTETNVEACDDGNPSNNDSCLTTCVGASCGDGFTWDGVEECDDANASNADDCLNVCLLASCGDGFVEDGQEECDDGNQIDNDSCRNDCTAPVCGDGRIDTGEECDDGNIGDNDGCGHTCLVERCGDGFVQLPAGETCDDGNLASGDGCDAACHVEPFATVPPQVISAGMNCTTSVANAARKVAVDGSGNLYAVMQCDIRAMAVTSTNRGNSFTAPFDLSTSLGTPDNPAVVSQVAVGNGPSRVAYAAMMLNNGQVYLRVTQDAGATWSPGVFVGQSVNTSSGLSLQSFNDNVYVGFAISGGVAVARNNSRGAGTFEITGVGMSIAFFDLVYDIALGTLAVVADTPGFHVRVSNDGGLSFNGEVNPPGQEYYSDWTIGNGFIFVSGTNLGSLGDSNSVYRIPSSNPATSTRIFGLPAITTAQARTVAADAAGNLFAGSQLDGGGIQLDRLGAGTSTFSPARLISVAGSAPIVCGLPGNSGAAMVYTNGGQVYATVQTYP